MVQTHRRDETIEEKREIEPSRKHFRLSCHDFSPQGLAFPRLRTRTPRFHEYKTHTRVSSPSPSPLSILPRLSFLHDSTFVVPRHQTHIQRQTNNDLFKMFSTTKLASFAILATAVGVQAQSSSAAPAIPSGLSTCLITCVTTAASDAGCSSL